MRHYRFSILLAVCVSLGLTQKMSSWTDVKLALSDVAVAQTAQPNSQPSPSANSAPVTYEQSMKVGTEAITQKNYPKAVENFQNALKQRPNDPLAQKALSNAQSFQAQATPTTTPTTVPTQTQPTTAPKSSPPILLILGVTALSIALLGALVSLLSRYRPSLKMGKEARVARLKSNTSNTHQSENGAAFSSEANPNNFSYPNFDRDSDHDRDASLPVQATTRIPNVDLILELINNLRDPEPRNRRRAIWKLAQMSDSRSMQPLVDVMIDTDSYERSLILEALAQICTRTLRPMNQALAISLQDKNPQVRKNAIRDLTRIYDIMSQISQLISHAIDDTDEEVQETAKWAIRQLNLQMPPRLDIAPLETTAEEDVEKSSYTESTEL